MLRFTTAAPTADTTAAPAAAVSAAEDAAEKSQRREDPAISRRSARGA
jgi:hypothetical protein